MRIIGFGCIFVAGFVVKGKKKKQTIILNEQVAIAELGLYRFFNNGQFSSIK